MLDPRDEIIAKQNEIIARQAEIIAEQAAQIAALQEQLAKALARIAELEEKLRTSSRNSGNPPSSDTPAQAAERRRKAAGITKPAGRKPGGQPGHKRSIRPLVPRHEVDHHVQCVPSHCGGCGGSLRGRDARPWLHQVAELPPVRPTITQYALHALTCPRCARITRATLPAGVPRGAFGPTVVATVVLLFGVCRLGKRVVQTVMADMFGLQMSLGAIIGCQKIASAALRGPVEEAKTAAQRAGCKHSDETSWREGVKRSKVWLWTLVTKSLVVFQIHKQRSEVAARDLLGKVKGVLVSDRYSAYGFWPLWLRQICWAHLIRDFIAISERGGESRRIGEALLEESRRLFAWWHRVRDGDLKRRTFQVYTRSLQKRVRALLEEGRSCAHSKTANTCAKIIRAWPALWLFVERPGIQPTNNSAEHAVRHAVLWRKSSGGTHSELGSRFVERILTVVATLRLQDRNVMDFLRRACEAHFSGSELPSLLPRGSGNATTHQTLQAAS